MCIEAFLVFGLGSLQVALKFPMYSVDARCPFFSGRIVRAIGGNEFNGGTGVISIIGIERGGLCRGVLGIIVYKFSQGKHLGPIVLVVIAVDS